MTMIKSLFSRIVGILFLTATSVQARPIGGYAHRSRGGQAIAMDSPLGIAILVGVGILLLVVALLVVRAMKRKR